MAFARTLLVALASVLVLRTALEFGVSGRSSEEGIPTAVQRDHTFADLDINADGIDDRFHQLDTDLSSLDGRIGINVHFIGDDPSVVWEGMKALRRISSYGPVLHRVGRSFPVLYVTCDEGYWQHVGELTDLSCVTFVELRPPVLPMLDISAGAVRAASSSQHSPRTARDLGFDGSGVNIAILDTGVDNVLHESFRGRAEFGVDFTGLTAFPGLDPDDNDGHGTHCAGIALGTGGQTGTYAGVAPGSGLIDLRIAKLQGDLTGNLDAALEWLIENHRERDVRVASISFGSTYSSSGTDTTSMLANLLVDEGVVVVVAAGNSGAQGIPSPAAADKVITVGASSDRGTLDRDDDAHESFSNRGPRASDGDGDPLDEMKPDVLAPGRDIMSAAFNTAAGYVEQTGTSMSCPHVAGIAALMLQANPDLSPSDIKSIIRTTSQQDLTASVPEEDPKYNYRSGWGWIDAYGAVKRCLDLRSIRLEGPSSVTQGSRFDLALSMNATRTEYEDAVTGVSLELVVDGSVGSVEVTGVGTGDVQTEYSLIGPYRRQDGSWFVSLDYSVPAPVEGRGPHLGLSIVTDGPDGSIINMTSVGSIGGMPASTAYLDIPVSDLARSIDLSIVPMAIWFSDQVVEGGDRVTISVRVNNTGNVPAESALVRLIDGPERTGEVIGEERIDVPGGGWAIASFSWEANPGVHAITAVADPDDAIDEPNELNNSAERPMTVLGINPPPVAQLIADQDRVPMLGSVTFDGSSSYDTNVRGGNVVYYNFDFGDGTQTGWTENGTVAHMYREAGTYVASLKVKDNGGSESSNEASVQIEVLDLSSSAVTYHLDGNMVLVEEPPTDSELTVEASNGQEVKAGEWRTEPFPVRTALLDSASLQVQVSGAGSGSSMRMELWTGGSRIATSGAAAPYSISDDVMVYAITVPIGDAVIAPDEELMLTVLFTSPDPVDILLGKDRSFLVAYPVAVPNRSPVVDAGQDMEVKAKQTVQFSGSATDEDGYPVRSRWDVYEDGDPEAEGPGVIVFEYEGFESEGTYQVLFEVRDDDGAWGSDTLSVKVWPEDHDFRPLVWIDPLENPEVAGSVELSGGASDDGTLESVEVRVITLSDQAEVMSWSRARGTESWYIIWDSTLYPDGIYGFQARSFDGGRFSEVAQIDITISNPSHPPSIVSVMVEPMRPKANGIDPVMIHVTASDLDLPEDVLTATIDLSELGGPSRSEMDAGGSLGEEVTFSVEHVVPAELNAAEADVLIEVRDASGRSAFQVIEVFVELEIGIDVRLQDRSIAPGGVLVMFVDLEMVGSDVVVEVSSDGFLTTEAIRLTDDGAGPDRAARDGTFSLEVRTSSEPGTYDILITVIDHNGTVLGEQVVTFGIAGSAFVLDGDGPVWPMLGAVAAVLGLCIAAAAGFAVVHDRVPSRSRLGTAEPLDALPTGPGAMEPDQSTAAVVIEAVLLD